MSYAQTRLIAFVAKIHWFNLFRHFFFRFSVVRYCLNSSEYWKLKVTLNKNLDSYEVADPHFWKLPDDLNNCFGKHGKL